ncbi:MAG: type I DNA topoisomerase [Bacillota bacterium]|nr:type I DNA topoisomerase [Bacillota bacterium]
MARSLVIVESPAKARTIGKFLGRSYHVEATMGHVRDLPKSQLGVDVEAGFEPRYITIRGKGEVVKRLREQAAKAEHVLLATDPDREGEAISWHLAQLLGLDPEARCRVAFHEITRETVRASIREPRAVDRNLVDAQQARRVLDRLVGYRLSPLLWHKVRRGLSAGRVQSVAVRILCDREEEIERFVPEEYWSLTARWRTPRGEEFEAEYRGRGETKVTLGDEGEVRRLVEELAGLPGRVVALTRRQRRRQPAPPFITSTLQQEAARKLGFSPSRTMRVAQQLYEGIAVRGEGEVGLITYMRTDSTRTAQEARDAARRLIVERWGDPFSTPRERSAAAGAQDAHEAIRPTSVARTPDLLKEDLTRDQYRLYRLIWERFLASQMSPAVYDTVTAEIDAGEHRFRAVGSTLVFPGFTILYQEGRDEEGGREADRGDGGGEEGERPLPPLEEGMALELVQLLPEQHWTQPPARYTDASLIRALEERGIGRPSTYAPIVETIVQRGYVSRERRTLVPTELGRTVTRLLKEHFPDIVDVEFTARMESELDRVEAGEAAWREVVADFYGPFAEALRRAEAEVARVELPSEPTDEVCDLCGRPMVIKHGRYGPFLACTGYPECRRTRPLLEKVGVACPECGGELVARRSRKGRRFYGCSNYPRCTFVSWDRPVEGRCPNCGGWLVERRGRNGAAVQCGRKCGYVQPLEEAAVPQGGRA